LFNALNTPSTLSPYDANGDFTVVPATTGLGNEIINPLAQIENTYNDFDFKKLNGNFGLDYKLLRVLFYQVHWVYPQIASQNFAKEINYGGKVLMCKEVR
jgi:hypothetical protein